MSLSHAARKALSHFATGVTVVTAADGADRHGMTCSAFCSVHLNPPTILVSLTKNTRTVAIVERSRSFVVNVLGAEQSHVSDRFAGRHKDKEGDRYEGIAHQAGVTGAPVLHGTQAHLECRVVNAVESGDHVLFLGEVVDAKVDETASPLIYFGSGYRSLEPR